jgi:rubrerythrin
MPCEPAILEFKMTRAFATLNAQEALHVAIFIEDRNAGIYHRFAEMFTEFRDPDSLEIASVFWDMAVEEKRHSGILQAKYQEQYGNAACSLNDESLQEFVELPRLEDADVFAAGSTSQDNARGRALQVALAAEMHAHDFYSKLVAETKDGPLRRLYTELSMMEDGHVVYLERILATSSATSDTGVH